MKKYLLALLIANSFIAISAQTKSEKQPYLTKSFSGQSINNVVAETSGGNISVIATDASQAHVDVYIATNNGKENLSKDELTSRVNEDYDLDVSVNNNKLTVTAKPKHKIKDWKRSLNFSFEIYTPKNVSTDLETSGGNVVLTGISGNQDFTTSGGNLDLDGLSGKVKGTTSGGNIYVRNSKDDIDLTTSGGNIEANDCSGNLTITTSGGSIRMNGLHGKTDASTSGGNIEGKSIEGDLAAQTSGGNVSLRDLNCSLKTSTSAGNIEVSIKNAKDFILISNSSGRINLELPGNTAMNLKLNAQKISTKNLSNFSGTNSDEEVKGTVNGGGIPVNVDAGGGRINVMFN